MIAAVNGMVSPGCANLCEVPAHIRTTRNRSAENSSARKLRTRLFRLRFRFRGDLARGGETASAEGGGRTRSDGVASRAGELFAFETFTASTSTALSSIFQPDATVRHRHASLQIFRPFSGGAEICPHRLHSTDSEPETPLTVRAPERRRCRYSRLCFRPPVRCCESPVR